MPPRNPLRPFPPFPHAPGQWYSPLDAKAEAMGAPLVERAFAECPVLPRLARAIGQLIGDEACGMLALKKSLHWMFEGRLRTLALRTDPPEAHGLGAVPVPPGKHPLDSWLAGGLGLSVRPAGWAERLWHRIELVALAVSLVGRTAWIGLRFGKRRVVPRACRLLALNAAFEPRWAVVAEALAEHAGFRPGDLLAEGDRRAPGQPAGLPIVLPATLPVAIGPWLRDAVLGSARLAMTALASGFGDAGDARAVEAANQALRLANRALDMRRLVGAVRSEVYGDNTEQDTRHILIGALAPRARVVRLPHSDIDTYGVALSYLGYDVFFSSGTYQFDSFGRTWLRSAHAVGTGPLHEDRRLRTFIRTEPEYSDAIEAELAKGRRMVVLFGPSAVVGIWPPLRRAADVVLDAVGRRDDWFLVVKPKRSNRLYEETAHDPDLARRLRHERVICVRYPDSCREVCPARYLMDKMTLGIALGGSTITEGLCRSRVMMAYYPVIGETPLRRKLLELGLLHATEESFRNTLNATMDNPDKMALPFAWFRERFDPFGNDRALDRFAEALYPHTGAAETPSAVRVARNSVRSP
jgi:hypothetical protein